MLILWRSMAGGLGVLKIYVTWAWSVEETCESYIERKNWTEEKVLQQPISKA